MELLYSSERGNVENKKKLYERKAFADVVEIGGADLKGEVFLFVFEASLDDRRLLFVVWNV